MEQDHYDWFMRRQGITIDAKPPGYRERWRRASLLHAVIAIFLLGLLPLAILTVGIVALAVWTAVAGV